MCRLRMPLSGRANSAVTCRKNWYSKSLYKSGDKCFFLFCFAKNDKDNLEEDELRVFKNLSRNLLSHGDSGVEDLLKVGEIVEVTYEAISGIRVKTAKLQYADLSRDRLQ